MPLTPIVPRHADTRAFGRITFRTVEENVRQGGFGSAILEGLNDRGITGIQLERIGIEDTFVEQGPQDFLRDKYGVNYKAIVSAATELVHPHDDCLKMKAAGTSY